MWKPLHRLTQDLFGGDFRISFGCIMRCCWSFRLALSRLFQKSIDWVKNEAKRNTPFSLLLLLIAKRGDFIEYIKGDRFGSEFIERRRIGLQWFLDRIARHPELQQSQCTRVFLESTDFVSNLKERAECEEVRTRDSCFGF